MSASELIRWGWLAGMLAGAAFIVLMLIPEGPPGSFLYILNSLVFIVAVLLMLVGLAGFHALQKGNYGRIGRAGFYTVIAAASGQIVAQVGLMSGSTAVEFLDSLGLLGVMVGFVLYGAATLQARVLPRWCGVALIIFVPVSVALGAYGNIWVGLVQLALGYVLWSRSGTVAEQPSRVR